MAKLIRFACLVFKFSFLENITSFLRTNFPYQNTCNLQKSSFLVIKAALQFVKRMLHRIRK